MGSDLKYKMEEEFSSRQLAAFERFYRPKVDAYTKKADALAARYHAGSITEKQYDAAWDRLPDLGAAERSAYNQAKKIKEPRAYETNKRTLKEKASGYVALAKHHLRKIGVKKAAPKKKLKKQVRRRKVSRRKGSRR